MRKKILLVLILFTSVLCLGLVNNPVTDALQLGGIDATAFFLRDGSRTATGGWNLDNNSITNVGFLSSTNNDVTVYIKRFTATGTNGIYITDNNYLASLFFDGDGPGRKLCAGYFADSTHMVIIKDSSNAWWVANASGVRTAHLTEGGALQIASGIVDGNFIVDGTCRANTFADAASQLVLYKDYLRFSANQVEIWNNTDGGEMSLSGYNDALHLGLLFGAYGSSRYSDEVRLWADSNLCAVADSTAEGYGEFTVYKNSSVAGTTITGGEGITFNANNSLRIEATADDVVDDRYRGVTISGLNAGENITQWDAVYFDQTDSEYKQADADAANEFPARGIAVAAGTDGNELIVLIRGYIRNDGWNWTVGGTIYLDDTTAGGLTQTAPSDSGDAVQVLGWATSDDEMFVNVSGHWLEVE